MGISLYLGPRNCQWEWNYCATGFGQSEQERADAHRQQHKSPTRAKHVWGKCTRVIEDMILWWIS